MEIAQYKAGYVSIIGRPNVGKSTLMNQLLDFKLSITSPRPQTTRKRVMGIINKPDFQIICLDTPGLLTPKYKLQKALDRYIETAINDADVLLYLVDCKENFPDIKTGINTEIKDLDRINSLKKPVILSINKIDLLSKEQLLPLIETYAKQYPFSEIVPVSAIQKDGMEELLSQLTKYLPYHPPYYDPDILTEQPERFFVSEFIREQIFMHFRDEIPFSTEVQIEEFIEQDTGKDLIRAVIFVERDSQKGILIGKRGSAIKLIGSNARKTIEAFLERQIFLELRVKVSKNWRKNERQIGKFGY